MGLTAADLRAPLRFLAIAVLCACTLLFLGGLAFRAFGYWRLPVAPGDAYGLADIIEYAVGMLLMLAAASSFALGLLLVLLRALRLAGLGVALLLIGAGAALTYLPLHALVASASH